MDFLIIHFGPKIRIRQKKVKVKNYHLCF